MKIAVAGATGRVGRHVVEVLELGGHRVVPMSRARGVRMVVVSIIGIDRIPEIAGPRVENLAEAATLLVARRAEPIRGLTPWAQRHPGGPDVRAVARSQRLSGALGLRARLTA